MHRHTKELLKCAELAALRGNKQVCFYFASAAAKLAMCIESTANAALCERAAVAAEIAAFGFARR